jgi:hypothetical protein
VVIASCDGSADVVVLVAGVARFVLSVRATNIVTATTSVIAATIAATPTTHGHRGGAPSRA